MQPNRRPGFISLSPTVFRVAQQTTDAGLEMNPTALMQETADAIVSQVCRALRDEIGRFYRPGDFLPTEQTLARRFAVNRHTMGRVIDELVSAGVLERLAKGTFVLDVEQGFMPDAEADGAQVKIIRRLVFPARGGVASRLALAEGELVIGLETLRLVNGRPFCLISHFLPHVGFERVNETYASGPLHPFLCRRFGVELREVEELATARLPQGDDAALLAIPRDTPLLRVKRVYVDDRSGRRIEYALLRFRADRLPPHLEI